MEIILPDIVSAGIYNTDIAIKNKTITKNRKTTMFEVELPIENGGTSYINSSEAQICTNTIICAKPGQMRHTKLPFKCYYIHMIVNDPSLYDILISAPDFIEITDIKKYLSLFRKISKSFGTGLISDEIILQASVLELIATLERDSAKAKYTLSTKDSNRNVIEYVIRYIKENLTSDLSLAAVSEVAGFSPIHFHNCFKASTGKTLRDYVEEQRIKQAINMLVSTSKTLTEIAYLCGFSSQSYFSYAFKRKMHMTPREYTEKKLQQYGIESKTPNQAKEDTSTNTKNIR